MLNELPYADEQQPMILKLLLLMPSLHFSFFLWTKIGGRHHFWHHHHLLLRCWRRHRWRRRGDSARKQQQWICYRCGAYFHGEKNLKKRLEFFLITKIENWKKMWGEQGKGGGCFHQIRPCAPTISHFVPFLQYARIFSFFFTAIISRHPSMAPLPGRTNFTRHGFLLVSLPKILQKYKW